MRPFHELRERSVFRVGGPTLHPHDWERLQATVQRRVRRYFRRHGLERLVRYCARPPFALERLHAPDGQPSLRSPNARLIYRLPGPTPDGRVFLVLSPLELLQRLARQRFARCPVFDPSVPDEFED